MLQRPVSCHVSSQTSHTRPVACVPRCRKTHLPPRRQPIRLGCPQPCTSAPRPCRLVYPCPALAEERETTEPLESSTDIVWDPQQEPRGVNTIPDLELEECITQFAAGLQALGLKPQDKVSLFSESSSRWIVADQGIMMNGAADAVRGSTVPVEELAYILSNSDSVGLVVQDAATLSKLLPAISQAQRSLLRFVVVLWDNVPVEAAAQLPGPVHTYTQVLALGQQHAFQRPHVSPEDLATLVYTSGTSGEPKGVMLSHSNILYQVKAFPFFMPVAPGETNLSLLPPWHIYQRAVSYYLFSRGALQVYSNIRKFREDLTAYPPDHFVCVPLVLDTLYSKVMHKLRAEGGVRGMVVKLLVAASLAWVRSRRVVTGTALQFARQPPSIMQFFGAALLVLLLQPLHKLAGKLVFGKIRTALGIRKTVVSGGGSLAAHLDDFFEMIDLPVINGWGLTETSPVLACRQGGEPPASNVRGTVGLPTPGTQLLVVDPETLQPLPDGTPGVLLARGPGVMMGYHRDEEGTARAFAAGDGWYNTGDLGWRVPHNVPGQAMDGCVVLSGRAKDTIVLLSGENVAPQPLEDAIASSPLIKHAIVVGQDKRELGVLLFPDEDALKALAEANDGQVPSAAALDALLLAEAQRLNKQRRDYRQHEHIAHGVLVRHPLSVEDGTLTRTMKPRRAAILQQHAKEVQRVMHMLR